MRKVLAIFLAATLLCVSSVPAFAEAASCAGPEVAAITAGGEHAMHHDDGLDEAHLGHDHSAGLSADWQKDRIECGCGCHRSVDALPHLLAPHTFTSINLETGVESREAPFRLEVALVCSTPRIPIPPPQSIS
ncbi:hypothetical protein Ga0123462_0351 [Mariprofundus ferrinatatus]|uniref:Uncharacterized protein n=1 Tax=Mariprofundus ferrinatatus TaxID=1921087 RepID=A0A2K8LAE5_9PROT|nr:hypothetical protein [Mariprofundus ferrinatatus]ATX81226.1 hypothetical protein Ga0123462_0351 [Mariprofundus ferrinatatus]